MRRKTLKMCVLGLLTTIVFSACKKDGLDEKVSEQKNQAPTEFLLEAPSKGDVKASEVPTFKWSVSKDPEKGGIVYELYLSKDINFPDSKTKKAVDIKTNQFTFSNYKLERLTTYYWKVVAYDKAKLKTSSKVSSFKTVDVNLKINLLAPQNAVELTNKEVKLSWEIKRNTFYKEEVTYAVFLRNGSDVFINPAKKGLTDTNVTFRDLSGNGKYYWSVAVLDTKGGEITKSEILFFTTPNTLPTSPKLSSQIREVETSTAVDVTIKWQAATDVDRIKDKVTELIRDEKLTYEVYLSTDSSLESTDIKQAEFNNLEFEFKNLAFNTDYWSKVVVKDENGGVVSSNVITFKTMPKTVVVAPVTSSGTVTIYGKVYKTETINGKVWLAENYAYIPYLEKDDLEGNKMICSVYGEKTSKEISELKSTENYTKYGVLYSGYALKDKDLIPTGWHIATDEEWKVLEQLSGLSEIQANNTGYKFGKRGITMHKFIAESESFNSEKAEKPTNEMKTSVKYGGYLSNNFRGDVFKGVNVYTYFWTNTEGVNKFGGGKGLYFRAFSTSRKAIERDLKGHKNRMYIRLVKD